MEVLLTYKNCDGAQETRRFIVYGRRGLTQDQRQDLIVTGFEFIPGVEWQTDDFLPEKEAAMRCGVLYGESFFVKFGEIIQ